MPPTSICQAFCTKCINVPNAPPNAPFRLVFRKAIITKDLYATDRITDDPSDNKFLACALEAQADYIVSGDRHLRDLKQFHGVKIIDVKTFVEKMRKK